MYLLSSRKPCTHHDRNHGEVHKARSLARTRKLKFDPIFHMLAVLHSYFKTSIEPYNKYTKLQNAKMVSAFTVIALYCWASTSVANALQFPPPKETDIDFRFPIGW